MKKTIPILLTLAIVAFGLSATYVQSADTTSAKKTETSTQKTDQIIPPMPPKNKNYMKRQFEQRLNLTEKQREKAKEIHRAGKAEIIPIITLMKVKEQEIDTVKLSKLSTKAQQEKIAQLETEIKELDKKADEIRKRNSQDFEKILNKKQKAELEKMKAEGRARFEKNHPPKGPFPGFIAPSFFSFRPLFPPPPPPEEGFWR